jgi:hypothetical protein
VITDVSGNLTHGTPLTISGRSFGSDSAPGPVVWDNVESGEFSPNWGSSRNLSVGTRSRNQFSNYCGTNNFQGSGGDGGYGYFVGPSEHLGERWFVQYWFQIDGNFDWGTSTYGNGDENLANVKIFRMWNPGSVDENFVMALHGYVDSAPYLAEYVDDSGGGRAFSGFRSEWQKGVWHCLQFEYKESSVGVQDGEFRIWLDGKLELDDRTIKTREDFADLKRPFIVGFYDSWNDSGTDRDDFFIDDVYIDNSWARVELGNALNYSECTIRETQIPTEWDDGTIEVVTNLGSLASSPNMYLFVTDADGNTTPGYLVKGDGEPDPGPPGQPGQPERSFTP